MCRHIFAMPKSALSDDELALLFRSVLEEGGRSAIDQLLQACHEFKTSGGLLPHERYFCKELVYDDFVLRFPFVKFEGETVMEADLQFKRPSQASFFWSPSRPLVSKILKLLRQKYAGDGIRAKDEEGVRQIHFDVLAPRHLRVASSTFEQWDSECSIYDEPCSSGQTDPNLTPKRNDFVIVRFRRRRA